MTKFEEIKQAAHDHFKDIYSKSYGVSEAGTEEILDHIPRKVSPKNNRKLIAQVTLEEIQYVLEEMSPDKAPGPDGFTARALTACWPIVHKDLLRLVRKSQNCTKLGGATNSAFLALIPKEKRASSFARFRPISLCNIRYKIITKVMANRLKGILPKLIPENQGGFIKG